MKKDKLFIGADLMKIQGLAEKEIREITKKQKDCIKIDMRGIQISWNTEKKHLASIYSKCQHQWDSI